VNNESRPFEIDGIHHLALVSGDMERTVDFYTKYLGCTLVKTTEMPGGRGQHFFLEFAPGQSVAFFWYRDAPEKVENVSAPGFGRVDETGRYVNRINGVAAKGAMHHVAFRVPLDKIAEYQKKLADMGLAVSDVVHHYDTRVDLKTGEERHEDFCLSLYFQDPDGIALEFCAYTRALSEVDVEHAPWTALGVPAQQPAMAIVGSRN
jgi:catechol 2,3-dioxygenase-like lactoylglutathione lyase family enzyme